MMMKYSGQDHEQRQAQPNRDQSQENETGTESNGHVGEVFAQQDQAPFRRA
jgi:hypothetical protein